jgi:hypothetical protein
MAWIPKEEADRLESETLTGIYDACRKNVARLDRYTESRDRDLGDLVNDLVISVRTLARSLRNKIDANGGAISHEKEIEAFKRSHGKVIDTLNACIATF